MASSLPVIGGPVATLVSNFLLRFSSFGISLFLIISDLFSSGMSKILIQHVNIIYIVFFLVVYVGRYISYKMLKTIDIDILSFSSKSSCSYFMFFLILFAEMM